MSFASIEVQRIQRDQWTNMSPAEMPSEFNIGRETLPSMVVFVWANVTGWYYVTDLMDYCCWAWTEGMIYRQVMTSIRKYCFVIPSHIHPKKLQAVNVVLSQTVANGSSITSLTFLATSVQSAGSLLRRPFWNPIKGASVSTITFSNGMDGKSFLSGAPRSNLQIVPVNPM